MRVDELLELFNEIEDEDGEFDRITSKLSPRSDLHAFMLLSQLVPESGKILCAAGHDQIWLDICPEELAKVVTKEQVVDLIRCGIDYEDDGLTMRV